MAERARVDAVLRAAGCGGPARSVVPVGGGSIAAAYKVETAREAWFLKWGAADHPFEAEAQALREIAATATVRVPRPVGVGRLDDRGWLLLEWVDLRASGDWVEAGRRVAAMHGHLAPRYGWSRDNTIGATLQSNAPADDWCRFFVERRLGPQLALAAARGLQPIVRRRDATLERTSVRLAGHRPPASLLHGDLWRGNLAFDDAGTVVLFDPATYHGDAETDLAMARLFGGFPPEFEAAYRRARPPPPDASVRLPLYQLYHLLNHANLFGGGYVAQACAVIDAL